MNPRDLIHKYFENSLTEQEKEIFENQIQNDPEFAELFAFESNVKSAITNNEREKLRAKLKGFEKKNEPRKIKFQWYAVAASVLFLFGFYFVFFNQNESSQDLYENYFEVYPNVVQPIVRDGNSVVNEAFIAYEKENYEESAQLFNAIYESSEEEYARFYEALSLLNSNKTQQAAVLFESHSWSENYVYKVNWFLALAKLKQNQIPQAKELLLKNIHSGSYKSEESEEILEELD